MSFYVIKLAKTLTIVVQELTCYYFNIGTG